MELTVRDVRLEDAEASARILNAIIAERQFSALDTPVTIEREREFACRVARDGPCQQACPASSGRCGGEPSVPACRSRITLLSTCI